MTTNKGPRLSFKQNPVLMVEVNRGECPRCKGATKIPNLGPGPQLKDCPTCEGTGRIEMLEPIVEADLDEAVMLGMELAQLRRAKEVALDAARQLKARFVEIGELLSTMNGNDLDGARASAAEGQAQASDLIAILDDGGVQ